MAVFLAVQRAMPVKISDSMMKDDLFDVNRNF